MRIFKVKTLLVVLLSLVFAATAMAADAKPKYKKTTGQVVSANQTSIVIKGRSKQVAMAVNAGTEIIGAKAAKPGDKAAVNYRVDKSGNTATRIKVLSSSEDKPVTAATASAAAAKQQ